MRSIKLLPSLLWLISCGGKTIEIASPSRLSISVSDIDASVNEELIGETPLTVSIDQVKDKVVKLSAPGKLDQKIIFVNDLANQIFLNVSLKDLPKTDPKKDDDKKDDKPKSDSVDNLNTFLRLILRAYSSLAAGEFDVAIKVAEEAKLQSPKTAAPHIVMGLAHLKKGEKNLAEGQFSQAKGLDPADTDLDKLLELAR